MDGAMVRSEVHAGTRFSTRFQMSGIKSVHTELQLCRPKPVEMNYVAHDLRHISDRFLVRFPSPAPTCIDKKDADKNPALKCGIFAHKAEK